MYDPEIRLSNLWSYENGLRYLTSGEPHPLSQDALRNILAANDSEAPPPQSIPLPDGRHVHYYAYESDSRNILIGIHGSACFSEQLHSMAKNISETNRAKVYVPDIAGHGKSSQAPGHEVTSPRQIIAELSFFIKHVKKENPGASIFLAGHSAGGGVVLALSQTEANIEIDGYILLSPYFGVGSSTNRHYFGGWLEKIYTLRIRLLALVNIFGISRFNNWTVVRFSEIAHRLDSRFVQSWSYHTMLAFGPGLFRNLQPISKAKPVLLLFGNQDECFLTEYYSNDLERVAPHGTAKDVGPLGHWDLLISDVTIQEIKDWLCQNERFP